MRKPTPHEDLFRWHRDALAGLKPPVTSEPQVGFFRRKFVRDGAWVPVRIWMDRDVDPDTGELLNDERMRCVVEDKERDPVEQWLHVADHPIPESEYLYLMSLNAWASRHAPEHPSATPHERVNFLSAPVPF